VKRVFGGEQRKAWEALGEAQDAAGDGQAINQTKAVLNSLLATNGDRHDEGNAEVKSKPVNIAAEVQLIYRPYRDQGRKLSHLPYKVFRCEAASELTRDAGGKRTEARKRLEAAQQRCAELVTNLLKV